MMMTLLLVLSLLAVFVLATEAHFSSQPQWRGVAPISRRRGFSSGPSLLFGGPRQVLLTSTSVSSPSDVFADEGEEEEDDEDYFDDGLVEPEQQREVVEFKDLSFPVKIVAGTWTIGSTIVSQYIVGFGFGYVLGSLRGVPHFLFRKEGLMGTPFKEEIPMRFKRWTGKAFRWGKIWGPISAAYGGLDATISVLRNGKQDEWNFILGTAAGGAFTSRLKGPQTMAISFFLYGGVTYVLMALSAKSSMSAKVAETPLVET